MEFTKHSSSSSSSSASSVRTPYDVFLSFRKANMHMHIVDHLGTSLAKAGMSVFRDESKEGTDEEIDPAPVEAIGQSKISIPIISQDYASSKSCLMRLTKMLDCRDTTKHAIIPIFYGFSLSEIGSFGHKKRGTDGRLLDSSKSALHRIGQLKGYCVDYCSDQDGRLISELVLHVTHQLNKAELVGTSMPVGIDNRVREMMTRLDVGTSMPVGIDNRVREMMKRLDVDYRDGQAVEIRGNEVRMVGIHGIPGVGKTTLAKFIYNQLYPLFEGCSYLGNIRETSKTSRLEHLQSQLVSDLLKREPISLCSIEEGLLYIKHRFCNMRVLIVLDDVDERHHLKSLAGKLSWFGLRSRIIVTTRNARLLGIPEVSSYEVKPMEIDQGVHLFYQHAFWGSTSHDDYDQLSREIVSKTGGLPLAIEVVGSSLYRQTDRKWKETLLGLKKAPDTIKQVLMTSYEALDKATKAIFLDIGCLFIGKDKRIPFYMWEDCRLYPSRGIERLLCRSLVKIGENNKLWMHDLLRDISQEIVRQEDPKNPGRRSRLWNHEEALDTLRRKDGTNKVEALCLKLDKGSHNCFTFKQFQSLSELRFLELDHANIKGDFTNLLSNLRWLDWQGCPATFEAVNMHLKKLVILDLSWSKVTQNWEGWSQIKMPRLKILNLTGCNEMLVTPNFSDYPLLEMLILERCFQLVEIDPSIGSLRSLVFLNLKSCGNLSMLPPEMGNMEAMEELLIEGTSIQEIPESIACMTKLVILSASNCYSLTYLPKPIGYMGSLSMLLLDNAKILELPDSIGSLVKLKQLSLRDCRGIRKLPESIGKLGCSLVELDISGMLILELPDSIRNLQQLRVLKMERCHVRRFPAVGGLRKLEEIHASHCRSLEGKIPNNIGYLQSLKILMLGYSGVSELPPSIKSLSRLQTLDLLACDNLDALPMLPSSLTCLQISSKKMRIIPDIRNLVELEELGFGDENPKKLIVPPPAFDPASILTEPQSLSLERFPKLKSLGLSHSQILSLGLEYGSAGDSQLKKVILTGANLQEVSGLPSLLSVLLIHTCLSLKSLPKVQNLNNLLELELLNSAVKEIEGLGGLTSLEILVVSHCPIVHLEGLSKVTSLKRLSLKNCNSLKKLPNVSNLNMLKVLEIHQCRGICDIEGLEELSSLEELHVTESEAERSLRVKDAQERIRNKARRAVINLMTENKTLKAKARTIAASEASGLKSAIFVGERGELLEVIAEEIDPGAVIDKLRRQAGLSEAWLVSFEDTN